MLVVMTHALTHGCSFVCDNNGGSASCREQNLLTASAHTMEQSLLLMPSNVVEQSLTHWNYQSPGAEPLINEDQADGAKPQRQCNYREFPCPASL